MFIALAISPPAMFLPLCSAQASLALRSLNRNILPLGKAQTSLALHSLNRNVHCISRFFRSEKAQASLAFPRLTETYSRPAKLKQLRIKFKSALFWQPRRKIVILES